MVYHFWINSINTQLPWSLGTIFTVMHLHVYAGRGLSHERNLRLSVSPSVCQTREL